MNIILKSTVFLFVLLVSCHDVQRDDHVQSERDWIHAVLWNKNFDFQSQELIIAYLDSIAREANRQGYAYGAELIDLVRIIHRDEYSEALQKIHAIQFRISNDKSNIPQRWMDYYMFLFMDEQQINNIADKYLDKTIDQAKAEKDDFLLYKASFDKVKRLRRFIPEDDYLVILEEYYRLFLNSGEFAKALHCYTLLIFSRSGDDINDPLEVERKQIRNLANVVKSIDSLYFSTIYLHQETYALRSKYNQSDSIIQDALQKEDINAKWFYPIQIKYEKASNYVDRIRFEKNKEISDPAIIKKFAKRGLEETELAYCLLANKKDEIQSDMVQYFNLFHNFMNSFFHKELGNRQKATDLDSEIIAWSGVTSKHKILAADYFENESLNSLKNSLTTSEEIERFENLTKLYEHYKQESKLKNTSKIYAYFAHSKSKTLEDQINLSNDILKFQKLVFYLGSGGLLLCFILLLRNRKTEVKIQIKNRELRQINDQLHSVNSQLERQTISLERSKQGTELYMRLTSHDLKSPVRNIRLMLGAIKSKYNITEWQSLFDIIYAGTERLYNLVSDMQSFFELAAQQELTFEKVYIREVVHQINSEQLLTKGRVSFVGHQNASIAFQKKYAKRCIVVITNLFAKQVEHLDEFEVHVTLHSHNGMDVLKLKCHDLVFKPNTYKFIPEADNSDTQKDFVGGNLNEAILMQIATKHNAKIRFKKDDEDASPVFELYIPQIKTLKENEYAEVS